MIVDKINKFLSENKETLNDGLARQVGFLSEWAFKRQFLSEREDSPGKLRLSGCGKCPRQLAYQYHGFEPNGKEIDPRGKITFFVGDVVELTLVALAKAAGVVLMATGADQATISLKIGDKEIFGHPDGVLFHEGKLYLFECKSMSSYGYERFEKGEIDESYLFQMNSYMGVLGLENCLMLAYNKDSSVIGERVIAFDSAIFEGAKRNLSYVLASNKEQMPERKFVKNEKGIYPWNCLYCGFYGHCLPEAKKVLVGSSYKLKG
jgi:hypothetical protein